jgi:hypothetical protein
LRGVGSEIDPRQFNHPTLAFVRGYWDAKRGDRRMPSRADIKPFELKEHLGWVSMVEVLPGFSDFRYRLIGTLVTRYFLEDSTGKTVREAFADRGESVVNATLAIFRKTARDCVPMRAFGDVDWMGRGFEAFDSLYLPLSDDGEHCNLVLNVFAFDREQVMLAREIANAHDGRLPIRPKRRSDAA